MTELDLRKNLMMVNQYQLSQSQEITAVCLNPRQDTLITGPTTVVIAGGASRGRSAATAVPRLPVEMWLAILSMLRPDQMAA